jgi:hypothetical protein
MSFELFSKRWKRDDNCPSCLYSLTRNRCVGCSKRRPHHLTNYWVIGYEDKKKLMVHNVLWVLDTKQQVPDGLEVDHIDRNGENNLQSNLRLLTSTEQKLNTPARKNSTSVYKGVSWSRHKLKWRSQVQLNKVKIFLGYFDTEIEAAIAYDFYMKTHGPECSYLNFQ